jgi:hypothetical protein
MVEFHYFVTLVSKEKRIGCNCKGILPLYVVLLIDENSYGMMFSLSLYEGVFHT